MTTKTKLKHPSVKSKKDKDNDVIGHILNGNDRVNETNPNIPTAIYVSNMNGYTLYGGEVKFEPIGFANDSDIPISGFKIDKPGQRQKSSQIKAVIAKNLGLFKNLTPSFIPADYDVELAENSLSKIDEISSSTLINESIIDVLKHDTRAILAMLKENNHVEAN